MRAELGLPSVRGDDETGGGMTGGFGGSMGGVGGGKAGKRPIQVKFEIPYFTTSGIQVRYLKITEPKVSPFIMRVHSIFADSIRSSNTRRYLGSDTLHNQATLPFGCPTQFEPLDAALHIIIFHAKLHLPNHSIASCVKSLDMC